MQHYSTQRSLWGKPYCGCTSSLNTRYCIENQHNVTFSFPDCVALRTFLVGWMEVSAQYQMLRSVQYFPSDSDVSVPGQIITWQHPSATWVAVRNVLFYVPHQFPCYCTFDALTSSFCSFVVVWTHLIFPLCFL